MWNKSTLEALGKCKVRVVNRVTKQKYNVDFVIVEDGLTPLLSRKAAEKMELITVNYNKFELVNAVSSYVSKFLKAFSDRPGVLPGGLVHLTVTPGAEPVVRGARTIPESLKVNVKARLDELLANEIISPVEGPSDWVNQMSISEKKSGEVRLCIDPRPLNKVLRREHYKLPLLEDILPELHGARKFSTCDLKNGYLHCELDPASSLLTTFATPFGRFRWRRLPYGLKVSSEIFQKRLHQALEGLEGVRCIADDIIVWGSCEQEHEDRLQKLLQRCSDVGISLNKEKCIFEAEEISFMGHIISQGGLKPDPQKIEAVVKVKAPTDREGVERLRGMVGYLSKFIPRLSEIMQPISLLLHKDVMWQWDSSQESAFEEIKKVITQAPVLAYFDATKQLCIQCDASSQGLGAALLQDGKPLAYASRCLSDVETRYATIEKEMLAIIFSLERWHQYT
jgi:hypothetical protein